MGGSRGKSKTQRGPPDRGRALPSSPRLSQAPPPAHWTRTLGGPVDPWPSSALDKTGPTGAAANGRRRVAPLHSVSVGSGWWSGGLSRCCRLPCLSSSARPGQSLQGLAAAYLQVQEALQLAWRCTTPSLVRRCARPALHRAAGIGTRAWMTVTLRGDRADYCSQGAIVLFSIFPRSQSRVHSNGDARLPEPALANPDVNGT